MAGLVVAIAAASGAGVRFISSSVTELNYSELRYVTSAIAVLLSWALFTKMMPLVIREFWWLALFFFAAISLAWAPSVRESFIAYAGWVCAVLIGALLAVLLDRDKASRLILSVMFWLSMASLALMIFVPSLGRIPARRPDGTIEQMAVGVFAWNSELGLVAGVGTILAFAFWLTGRRKSHLLRAVLMLGVSVLSDSATGISALAVALVATTWACVPRLRPLIWVLAAAIGVLWLTGGIDALQVHVLNLLGRPQDLSGRSVIWQLALGLASEKPALGYGIGGSPDLRQYLGFDTHAHNGYIQLLLELGYVGAAIIGFGLLVTTGRAMKAHSPLLGVLALVLVSNIANNYLMTANVSVALLAWVVFALAKPSRQDETAALLSGTANARKSSFARSSSLARF